MDKKLARTFAVIGAMMGWFAVIIQLYLMIESRTTLVGETILRFFGYFTIDTNTLCALCLSLIAINNKSGIAGFFCKPVVVTALTVYIIVVGITYNLLLRSTWNPQGMQKIIDELLHSIIPLYFLLFWLAFVPGKGLKWKSALPMTIYPLIYVTYALVFGSIKKFYLYPFVDVNVLGYGQALLNTALVLIVIFLLSLTFIGMGRRKKISGDGAGTTK